MRTKHDVRGRLIRLLLVAPCVLAWLAVGCRGSTEKVEPADSAEKEKTKTTERKGESDMSFELTSPAFENGDTIPEKYTGDGGDLSPPLRWTDPPEGTQSFALISDDPDAPVGTWVHWVIYGIPRTERELSEGVRDAKTLDNGARQGKNSWPKIGYGGPAPPPGKPHRYYFKLYALDTELALGPGATKEALLRAMEGHILAEAELLGKYGR